MKSIQWRKRRLGAFLLTIFMMWAGAAAGAQTATVAIANPDNGQVVSGTSVSVQVVLGSRIYWDQLQVDGVSVLSGGGNFTWNSTRVSDGPHTLTVNGFARNGATPIGTASVTVDVQNQSLMPTAAPSFTPTPSPTPSATPVATATPISNEVTIVTPNAGQVVAGSAVAVDVTLATDVYWDQLQVDGVSALSSDGNFAWDSTTVPDGSHTLTVRAFAQGGTTPLGTASVNVDVENNPAAPAASPTSALTPQPTSTPAPTTTPTVQTTLTPTPAATPVSSPTPTADAVTLIAPNPDQLVAGSALPVDVTLGPNVYWDQLMVDGVSVLSGDGNFTWDTTTVADGQHTLTVRAFAQDGTTPLGTASVVVEVRNYFATLTANAPLPSGAQCAQIIPTTPETAPWNTPFNQTVPTAAQLTTYAEGNYTFDFRDDYTQYKRVNGQYTGSTDMIIRWAACKYGIDENVMRAQAWVESQWEQGGAGDLRTQQSQCVQGSFTALWNSIISEPDGSTVSCPNCCYQSWSAWQTKVYYEWMTWPEIMQSTAFAADYRGADQRACMDGAYTTYFASSIQQPNTYATDVQNYKDNPDQANTDRVLWGCIGMHYSGSWYDPDAQTYIDEVQNAAATKPWPP